MAESAARSHCNGPHCGAHPLGRVIGIRSAEAGNFGDCAPVGDGISEMRIHVGPGYRLYYCRRGEVTYLLLCAGDKSSQARDIRTAKTLLRNLES
mgnify:CR=1 FL=1